MPFHEQRTQHQTARLLPRPLYILFVQGNAYHEACGKILNKPKLVITSVMCIEAVSHF